MPYDQEDFINDSFLSGDDPSDWDTPEENEDEEESESLYEEEDSDN